MEAWLHVAFPGGPDDVGLWRGSSAQLRATRRIAATGPLRFTGLVGLGFHLHFLNRQASRDVLDVNCHTCVLHATWQLVQPGTTQNGQITTMLHETHRTSNTVRVL